MELELWRYLLFIVFVRDTIIEDMVVSSKIRIHHGGSGRSSMMDDEIVDEALTIFSHLNKI